MLVQLKKWTYAMLVDPHEVTENLISLLWKCIQGVLINFLNRCQRKFPKWMQVIFKLLSGLLMAMVRFAYCILKKILLILELFRSYTNDKVLDKIFDEKIKLNSEDIGECNQILEDVVRKRLVSYMKTEDEDFDDLFQDILDGGSFYKDLKVSQPDEYDLCLMIDLTRSIESKFIKIETDHNCPAYVKIKICQTEFNKNENFWHNILDRDNYLNQNKFRDWIHRTLEKALFGFSGQVRSKNYIVRHRSNVYSISFRTKGPAFTLTIIKENREGSNWRKINVDLVPCLVFENQFLPGFRQRKSKEWIVVPKLLQSNVEDRELLWRAGFQEDEKKMLPEPIKPIIKLVKKLRDVKGWVHLKSYFIETIFMHKLDDRLFRFLCSKISRKILFIYMLEQIYNKLKREEILWYWHKGFNLLDRTNAFPLSDTAKKLKEFIDTINNNTGREDGYLVDSFYENKNTKFNNKCYMGYVLMVLVSLLFLHEKFIGPTDHIDDDIFLLISKLYAFTVNWVKTLIDEYYYNK